MNEWIFRALCQISGSDVQGYSQLDLLIKKTIKDQILL